MIQRTKRVDETQELLLSMLEDLTGAEEDKEKFMALCVQSLNKLKKSDLLTPVFIFERLCNIIRPVSQFVSHSLLSPAFTFLSLPPPTGSERCWRVLSLPREGPTARGVPAGTHAG